MKKEMSDYILTFHPQLLEDKSTISYLRASNSWVSGEFSKACVFFDPLVHFQFEY